MSNMLIYVDQICPHAPCAGLALWVETGEGGEGRKEFPSFSEAPGRHGFSLQQLLHSEVLWRKMPRGHLFPFYSRGKSTPKSPKATGAAEVTRVFSGL